MNNKSHLPHYLFSKYTWEGGKSSIWPATTFVLKRNIAGYHFPHLLAEKDADHLIKELSSALLGCPVLSNPKLLYAEKLTHLEREFLFEHFLASEEIQTSHKGQAFIVDASSKFLAYINVSDHLCLHFVDPNTAWQRVFDTLHAIEEALSKDFKFAYNDKFGFLTSDPTVSGTGFVIYSYLHVPATLYFLKPEEVLKELSDGVVMSSIANNLEFIGDIIVLKNHITLGVTEEETLNLMHSSALKLFHMEKVWREEILKAPSVDLKDQIARAYGLMRHSMKVELKEAISALSFVKLGYDLGWIQVDRPFDMLKIFFTCRRAHLNYYLQSKVPLDELSYKRANFLKETLQNSELIID